jgi:hypothetical protein
MAGTPRARWKAYPTLDPFGVAARESRDSVEHPASNAIAVMFDVTGSMGEIPITLQQKLPQLLGLLLRKGYVAHPQILFGAIGDATCDRVPLQVGQFESDNRMDEHLENLLLEGGGGGGQRESYELGLYFFARHTAIDCFEKRRRKGYLFLIGDEMAYGGVSRSHVEDLIGTRLQADIPLGEILREVRQRYHVFYIMPTGAANGGDPRITAFWRELLGQNFLQLDDPAAVCELIALTIGMTEGTIDLGHGLDDLADVGTAGAAAHSVSTALSTYASAVSALAVTESALPGLADVAGTASGTRRL